MLLRIAFSALLLSLGLNVYLVFKLRRAEPSRKSAFDGKKMSSNYARDGGPPTIVMVVKPEVKSLDVQTLKQRLLDVHAKLVSHLPPKDLFDITDRTMAREGQITPFLNKVFKNITYDVECHGEICALNSATDRAEWQEQLGLQNQGEISNVQIEGNKAYLLLSSKFIESQR